jgi:hypothetical protein
MPALLLVVLSAAPLKVATTGFEGAGVEPRVLRILSEQVAQRLAATAGVSVITPGDVETMLGLERRKQMLGCAEEGGGCLAELAGALGADVLLTGDISKVGTRYAATLKLLDARTGRTLSAGTADAGSEDELVRTLMTLADAAREVLLERTAPARRGRWQPAIPLAVGVGLAVTGAVFLLRANDELAQLKALSAAAVPTTADARLAAQVRGATLVETGRRDGLGAGAFFVAGGVFAGGALAWWLWPGAEVHVSLAVGRDGAAFAVQGRLP